MVHTDKEVNLRLLDENIEYIKNIFTKYNNKNNYLGVYFSQFDKLYITFSSSKAEFLPLIGMGRTVFDIVFIYDTKEDFDTQTAGFRDL